jgi:hypothetical protein
MLATMRKAVSETALSLFPSKPADKNNKLKQTHTKIKAWFTFLLTGAIVRLTSAVWLCVRYTIKTVPYKQKLCLTL